ncbi:MAG: ComF family protein [Bdellovibrionales bacterium]|nr:ComF family protein [Bdellovibrionales bacterium]
MLGKLLEFLYPSSCTVCGSKHNLSSDGLFCLSCYPRRSVAASESTPYGLPEMMSGFARGCSRCGEQVTVHNSSAAICVACAVWPLPIGQLRSQFCYEGSIEAAIKAMKYNGQRRLISFFAEHLADDLALPGTMFDAGGSQVQCCDFWDLLVPVPSTLESLKNRGYGHTAFIARKTAYALNITADVTVLRSIRSRKRQVDCSPEERFHNVADCFGAKSSRIKGRRILLLDDVLTTGATITSAAAALLDAGARSVDAITIARSRKFRSLRLIRSGTADFQTDKAIGWDE